MNIKTRWRRQIGLKSLLITPVLCALVMLAGFVLPAAAENLAQGFAAKGDLSPGMVVALTKNTADSVEVAPASDPSRIYGVVINPSDAPLILNRNSGDQVFIATSGTYQVLVSTEGGAISVGDYISMSSTDGIAAKATFAQSTVLGQAVAAFDGKTNSVTKIGNSPVGKIAISVNPRKNPMVKNDVAIPSFLRKIGESIAGKPISPLHIYAALALLLAAVVISTSLLTAGVRGAMIALGRNPLNRGSIMNSMFKVVSASALIFVIGLAGVYLLLKI
jgi:hypothetical protein